MLIYLLIMNAAAFLLMLVDKQFSKNGARRISESTLFLSAIMGGSLGVILGMHLCRHKTRHKSFVYGMPTILLTQLVLFLFLH